MLLSNQIFIICIIGIYNIEKMLAYMFNALLGESANLLPSFFVPSDTKGGGCHHPRLSVSFKILYRVGLIQRLIQHCLLSKMVYLNVKYVIATRSYFLYISLEISHFRGLLYL